MKNTLSYIVLTAGIIALCAFAPVSGHQEHAQPPVDTVAAGSSPLMAEPAAQDTMVGVEEKTGAMLPLDIPFINESGDTVMLRSLVRGPTVLCFLAYRCKNACNTLLTGLAATLRSFTGDSANAPAIVTISIDERETPADAVMARDIALQSVQAPYPAGKWRFLTGPQASIKAITAAAGFRFARRGEDYDHPLCLIVISPRGKVTRYIMGADYLPVDISMSLMEAAGGTVRPTIARVLRMCFSYDPKSHRFVFSVLRASLAVIGTLIGAFIIFLIVSGRNRAIRKGPRP